MKETEITIKVRLDQNNIPEEIMWSAPDGGMKDQLSKAIFLSFWDSNQKETLKMDLWTKEMPIDEMKAFMLQTIQSMNQTISKAIGNEDLIKIKWPQVDTENFKDPTYELVIQINGKKRSVISVEKGLDEKKILEKIKHDKLVDKYIEGKNIFKTIYVQDKILNLLVK